MFLNRRQFLQHSTAATLTALATPALAAPPTTETRNGMPYRALGKTGVQVSLLCLGGFHIGMDSLSDQEAITLMRSAVDEGINFFDNAWAYHNGRSEERMGQALRDGYREKVFLMTKHQGRDAASAQQFLEDSLRRLAVDHIDLWQCHEVIRPEEPGRIYNEGALEVALKAKEQGKIRFIGCTGHHYPFIQAEMIERGFPWDTIQFPVNLFDYHYRSFQQTVLPKALEKNIAVIAMKTLGGSPGALPKTGAVTVAECLRYAMSQPVATVCSGMDSLDVLRQNIATAKAFAPLSPEESAALLERAKAPAHDGKHEAYKTGWHKDIQDAMRKAGHPGV